ncbi:DDE-type integrase/transposase/recombinase [Mycobacterium sp.]|uniref:DDE-type integrase/transposase/recombinase n=1 Tax=Mycobacterium sp. TaxID=1785 RepID=UPI003F9B765B
MPNQCWQADVTHWHLAAGGGVEILNVIDDHSRLALAGLARRSIGGPDVLTTFAAAFTTWGHPQSVLTDNGAIFTGQPRRGGRTALEITLGTLGIKYLTSRPSTRRPAAKSSASTKPKRNGSPLIPPPH